MIPNGISPEVHEIALDNLGGVLVLVEHLPKNLGFLLLEVARDSFMHGMQFVVVIAVVLCVIAAILIYFTWHKV